MLFCTYLLISTRRKKFNRGTKHIMPQDQTYWFNYLIAQKLLLFFHSIVTSHTKSNTCITMGVMSNCSARYELTIHISFYFLNDWIINLVPPLLSSWKVEFSHSPHLEKSPNGPLSNFYFPPQWKLILPTK